MVNSSVMTADFFDLKPGDTALHCLPSQFIAGKMMLVRAMVLGLEIDVVEPIVQPIFDLKKSYDFCAMIPLQLEHNLNSISKIKTIIIGGSKVSDILLHKIKNLKPKFYETYGMTETATHIAVKSLNSRNLKDKSYFKALPNVSFRYDDRKCLVINAPSLSKKPIITNDIVDLKSNISFKLKGRFDNIVNSGGVKLVPEYIEDKLQPIIKERFIIAGEPNVSLGEKLVLIIENPSKSNDDILKAIKSLKTLKKFEIPKKIYTIDKFIETKTGKLKRKETIGLIG